MICGWCKKVIEETTYYCRACGWHLGKITSVRLKVEQNQLVAGIAQVVFEVRRLKCP
jgi:hypothetical protein